MILHIPSEATAGSARVTPSEVSAPVISLSEVRAQRRAKAEAALIDEIIASVQHIDVVRLVELAEEREAKRQMSYT